MSSVPRASVFTRQPTFHGARIEPPATRGPVYFGIAAVATVAIAAIVIHRVSPKRSDIDIDL